MFFDQACHKWPLLVKIGNTQGHIYSDQRRKEGKATRNIGSISSLLLTSSQLKKKIYSFPAVSENMSSGPFLH